MGQNSNKTEAVACLTANSTQHAAASENVYKSNNAQYSICQKAHKSIMISMRSSTFKLYVSYFLSSWASLHIHFLTLISGRSPLVVRVVPRSGHDRL
jgi:hypothetical protein